MNSVINIKIYAAPPICEKEILRYAGCRSCDEAVSALVKECTDEAESRLSYRVCYRVLPVSADNGICDIGDLKWSSKDLAANLSGCTRAVIFAATLGTEPDRLIARYGRISPSRALIMQAIGAERIEALCDTFCADIEAEYGIKTRARFSPGYGDLPIERQKDIFALLDCERKIGLTLNESLLMSPSKSVTAIVGMENDAQNVDGSARRVTNKCAACGMKNCAFRGAL